jgi:U3 small nucleolar RNA-associated protein 10
MLTELRPILTEQEEMAVASTADTHRGSTDELAINRQTALWSIDILAQEFAGERPLPFLECLPPLIATLEAHSDCQKVLGSGFLCLKSLIAKLGARSLPHFNKFMALILASLRDMVDLDMEEEDDEGLALDAGESLVVQAALSALHACVEQLSGFIAPYIPDILSVVLHPTLLDSGDAHLLSRAEALISAFALKVPPRILLPPVISHYRVAVQAGTASVKALFKVLLTLTLTLTLTLRLTLTLTLSPVQSPF